MSTDVIADLEKKVDEVLRTIGLLRTENEKLKSDHEASRDEISELEKKNQALQQEVEKHAAAAKENEGKLDMAADKIRNLIAKLAAA